MMVEITYQMVLSTLQTISIMVGIVYYLGILRNTQRTRELTLQSQELTRKAQELSLETRKTQLFMQVFQQQNTEENYQAWAELVNMDNIDWDNYIQNMDSTVNPTHYGKRSKIWTTYNAMGELLRMGIVDPDFIHSVALDQTVIIMWDKWEHIIRKIREKENMPDIWEGFEYLYNEMKSRRESKGLPEITY
jgi:hypothetical protein